MTSLLCEIEESEPNVTSGTFTVGKFLQYTTDTYINVTLLDPPGSPVNVTATIMSCDRVQLQWTPPTYPINYSPIKYNVMSSPAGSCFNNQHCTTTWHHILLLA